MKLLPEVPSNTFLLNSEINWLGTPKIVLYICQSQERITVPKTRCSSGIVTSCKISMSGSPLIKGKWRIFWNCLLLESLQPSATHNWNCKNWKVGLRINWKQPHATSVECQVCSVCWVCSMVSHPHSKDRHGDRTRSPCPALLELENLGFIKFQYLWGTSIWTMMRSVLTWAKISGWSGKKQHKSSISISTEMMPSLA